MKAVSLSVRIACVALALCGFVAEPAQASRKAGSPAVAG